MLYKFHQFFHGTSLVLLILMGMHIQGLNAQCHPDRHNTTAANSWLTCEATQSLNATRGVSHWILYDLGEVMEMGKMHFWNLNHPELLDQGAKTMVIDYSLDGATWEEWGALDLEMAQASGFYEGSEVADFDRVRARMLLLTITENHGGDCYGFAEVRVETYQSLNDNDLSENSAISLSPNPAIDYTRLSLEGSVVGPAKVILINALGQEVYQSEHDLSGGGQVIDLDLSDLPSGSYFVKVATATHEWIKELSIVSN